MIEQDKKSCAHMIDFCRPHHISVVGPIDDIFVCLYEHCAMYILASISNWINVCRNSNSTTFHLQTERKALRGLV